MQRYAWLLLGISAACGTDGAPTGEASISGTTPAIKSAAASAFADVDADGNKVLGWTIDLFENPAGADCESSDTKVVASVAIYTNQADGSKPQAILQTGGIAIVTTSPPSLQASAVVATMGAMGVANIMGQVTITEFHLTPDAMHADRISGSINAGGTNAGNGEAVFMMGNFVAPFCDL